MSRATFTLGLTIVLACFWAGRGAGQGPEPPRPLTVAFIGDQGSTAGASAVLRMIRAEGADLVLHQGDLDYEDDPAGWDEWVTAMLGADFPYFVSVGNHDKSAWSGPGGYQERLRARLSRVPDAHCKGDFGVRSACRFRGLFFILSGAGTIPDTLDDPDHVAFIREQLARSDAIWRICSWHKNQNRMQLGRKPDEVGWQPYEACRRGGAFVATGHEHSYARTHLMADFERQTVASTSLRLELAPGRSFAFVSGLGGHSIRNQDRGGPWWAAAYTSDQQANFGALFCTFFAKGNPRLAKCYFKDIDGRVPDRFDLISTLGAP